MNDNSVMDVLSDGNNFATIYDYFDEIKNVTGIEYYFTSENELDYNDDRIKNVNLKDKAKVLFFNELEKIDDDVANSNEVVNFFKTYKDKLIDLFN